VVHKEVAVIVVEAAVVAVVIVAVVAEEVVVTVVVVVAEIGTEDPVRVAQETDAIKIKLIFLYKPGYAGLCYL
jgi:hypothetical protein